MTCSQLAEFLVDYIADELAVPVQIEFERHLAECSACRRYLDSYRKTIQVSQDALRAPVPADVPEALVEAILRARQSYL